MSGILLGAAGGGAIMPLWLTNFGLNDYSNNGIGSAPVISAGPTSILETVESFGAGNYALVYTVGQNMTIYIDGTNADISSFTFEAWVYSQSVSSAEVQFGIGSDVDFSPGIHANLLHINGLGTSSYIYQNTTQLSAGAFPAAFLPSTWQHMALTYDGTTYRYFLRGQLGGSVAYGVSPNKSKIYIRVESNASGRIGVDGIRFEEKRCKWTSNFTPPNVPYTK